VQVPTSELSQQSGEAGAAWPLEPPVSMAQGRVGAAPSKPGAVSTARWPGSGEQDREA
jgi:hypothetical protein